MAGQRWSPSPLRSGAAPSRGRIFLLIAVLCAGLAVGYLLGAVPLRGDTVTQHRETQVQSNGDTPELTSKQPASGNSMAAVPERGGDAADWEALPQAVLDEARIRLGIAYRGDEARIRRLVTKLLTGEAVTLAVVGGSCAWGHGASNIPKTSFGPRFFAWMNATFPNPDHVYHNGAIPGTPSGYMALCVNWHVPPSADLVLVEYALNDGWSPDPLPRAIHRRAFERLLRRLLAFPRRPAVTLLMIHNFENDWFWRSAEDHQGVFAQYYSLPSLSWRNALWASKLREAPGLRQAEFTPDGRHPNDYGHQIVADLIAGYLQSVGRGLRERPYGGEDERLVEQELLPPMLPGNHAHNTQNCIMDEEFHHAATDVEGFEWVEEGGGDGRRLKPGFVATKPGAKLSFTIDSAATAQRPNAPEGEAVKTSVTISRLCSYEHMGQAEVKCVAGCACDPVVMDSHWADHTSQLVPFKVAVSQAPACRVEVTVLDSTQSGEHKVKINGVVVSDEAGEDTMGHMDVLIDKKGGAADGFLKAPHDEALAP